MLDGAALQLPESERDERRGQQKREQREAGHAGRARSLVHFARSTSRPGAALWWNCSAISSDFLARSGNSVVARISGSQSAACSQYGGWYLTSTISAHATTMPPASMMMKIAGPSPVSMKA